MKFFTGTILKHADKFVNGVMGHVSKPTQKTPVTKTICGKIVAPDGDVFMWGTVPGSMRCQVSRHDNASKVKAYQDAEDITKAGGKPQIDIIWEADSSHYGSDGIIVHRYTWRTKDIRTENQDDSNHAPHV